MAIMKLWYTLKVRPTFEDVVISELRNRDFDAFVPPRCSGEVLCRFSLDEKNQVLTVAGVLCILGNPEPAPVDDRDVHALRSDLRKNTTEFCI
jgi:hypothetical protein